MLKKDRIIRKRRVRSKISGTASRPRVVVYRSNRYLSAQAIDDQKGVTLAYATEKQASGKTKKERATSVGAALAEKLLAAKIKQVVFDRAGYRYHGRVQALSEGIREKGIQL